MAMPDVAISIEKTGEIPTVATLLRNDGYDYNS